MKNKLRGGPERIDLVGEESTTSGGSAEVEGLRDETEKEMEEIQINAQVDGERDDLHDENMQAGQDVDDADGGENSASPSSVRSDSDAEGTDEEDGDDEAGEGSDEEEADYDDKEVSDANEEESEDCEGEIIVMRLKLLVCKMNIARAAVEKIGFGSVLKLDIWELPSRLGLWVVSNYDARSSCLKLLDNRKMHITAEDVNTVLGWPIGGERIPNNKRSNDKLLLEEWRLKFDTTGIVEKMLQCTDGGEWFVRHFVTLIVSVLVDRTSHGYVNALVLDHLRDVGRVPKLNWCQYVLDKLIENKLKWEKKKKQLFSGPLLFLMVFYVDRVSDFSRTVPRTYPAVLAWSGKELRKRENSEVVEGGFGLGHDEGRMSREIREEVNRELIERERKATEERDNTDHENVIIEDSEEILVRKIADKSKILSSTVIDLLKMIQDAPKSIGKNLMFRKMRNVCHRVIGINVEKKDNFEQGVENNDIDMFEDSEFWSSPEVLAAVDKAEKGAEMRKKYEDFINDVPSFSLGMTQVLEEEGGGVSEMESTCEIQKSSEVNDEMTPANITHADPHNTPNMAGPLDTPSIEPEQNKDIEQNKGMIGAECDAVQNNQDSNDEMEVTVEERRVEGGVGLKRKFDEVVQNARDERARRKTKKALTLKSPYLTWVIDPRDNVNTFEKNFWKWVVSKQDADRNDIVFSGYNISVKRGDLQTLATGHHISSRVVDAWSCILNHKELFRSVASPDRFFAKTIRCMFMSEGEMEENADAFKVICDALEYGWSLTNPCDVDMIFFPVMQHRWCYCICVNLKGNGVDILDSSSAGVAKIKKYDKMPSVVRDMVVKYFKSKGLDGRVEKLKTQEPKRLQLAWRDSTAVFDYGVITMWHMETYTGQELKQWECGLKKGDERAVNALRTKYCAAIVESDINEVKDKIRQLVKHSSG
ncbi:unnamed protein product [Cuscuta campestris]|uniref:Ubiquitin-like protease family profile domain-containing protein n=1 Tax=Cuscuta campestris TaxID=132261 RepID=A0A484N3L5_9ASTE|nr:unnamed protein product [Cuscuta campestris]